MPERLAFADVRHVTSVDSTNRYLMDLARAGEPEGTVVVADHQTAGRGRLGRTWEALPSSALLVSVLLRPVVPVEDLYLATALVALSARRACQAAGVDVDVKWPNDLVWRDAKVAGVLAEADADAPGGPLGSVAVVVGVGLNISWPGPPDAGGTSLHVARAASGLRPAWEAAAPPTTPGDAAGTPVAETTSERDALLTVFLGELRRTRPLLDTPAGRKQIAADLRALCATIGRRVRVELSAGRSAEGGPAPAGAPMAGQAHVVEGLAVDLTATGHLVVETAGGRVEVAAGDVHHLRPHPDEPAGPSGSSDRSGPGA